MIYINITNSMVQIFQLEVDAGIDFTDEDDA
jgi:hypothetical protein